mmetsp:Transcript_65848/g.140885  ORF Transcript_65848/g.140885 Transcript_65848/m.140885 type:complete len:119 (+) Transcript_65848:117-473(+)
MGQGCCGVSDNYLSREKEINDDIMKPRELDKALYGAGEVPVLVAPKASSRQDAPVVQKKVPPDREEVLQDGADPALQDLELQTLKLESRPARNTEMCKPRGGVADMLVTKPLRMTTTT